MKAPGILLLIGGLLVLIVGALIAIGGALVGSIVPGMGALIGVIGGIHVIFGILLILAAMWAEKKKSWAWIGLVVSIIALIFGGGYYIGAILGIIGAALALKGAPKKGK